MPSLKSLISGKFPSAGGNGAGKYTEIPVFEE
jgi:hypothetical protein